MSRKQRTDFDFNEEAHALWARLNLDPSAVSTGKWNKTDAIWRHPVGKGTIFVGNQSAAEDLGYLKHHKITHVVNCTMGASKIPNFHERSGLIQYYTFPISQWTSGVNETDESVRVFVEPLFSFIDSAIENGQNVLVHCLAGAHRAGTTGCACLIYYAGLDVSSAILTAKRLRPIIDPIGQLPFFLQRLHRSLLALRYHPVYSLYDEVEVEGVEGGGRVGGGGEGKGEGGGGVEEELQHQVETEEDEREWREK